MSALYESAIQLRCQTQSGSLSGQRLEISGFSFFRRDAAFTEGVMADRTPADWVHRARRKHVLGQEDRIFREYKRLAVRCSSHTCQRIPKPRRDTSRNGPLNRDGCDFSKDRLPRGYAKVLATTFFRRGNENSGLLRDGVEVLDRIKAVSHFITVVPVGRGVEVASY